MTVMSEPSAFLVDSLQSARKTKNASFCKTVSIVMGCELEGAKDGDLLSPSEGDGCTDASWVLISVPVVWKNTISQCHICEFYGGILNSKIVVFQGLIACAHLFSGLSGVSSRFKWIWWAPQYCHHNHASVLTWTVWQTYHLKRLFQASTTFWNNEQTLPHDDLTTSRA